MFVIYQERKNNNNLKYLRRFVHDDLHNEI